MCAAYAVVPALGSVEHEVVGVQPFGRESCNGDAGREQQVAHDVLAAAKLLEHDLMRVLDPLGQGGAMAPQQLDLAAGDRQGRHQLVGRVGAYPALLLEELRDESAPARWRVLTCSTIVR